MVDYHGYNQAMKKAHEALEQAVAMLERQDLTPTERQVASDKLTQRAARFRLLAMKFAKQEVASYSA
jgi:hypothetical protein